MNRSETDEETFIRDPWHAEKTKHFRELAKKNIPDWAGDAFRSLYVDAMNLLYSARYMLREATTAVERHQARDQVDRYLDRACRIERLCNYNLELKGSWKKVLNHDIQDPDIKVIVANEQKKIEFLLVAFEHISERFEAAPKYTTAVKKEQIEAIRQTAYKFWQEINVSYEARAIASSLVRDFIDRDESLSLTYRSDFPDPLGDSWTPDAHSGPPREEQHSDTVTLALRRMVGPERLPPESPFAHLARTATNVSLFELLTFFVGRLNAEKAIPAPISKPGSEDQGALPFWIREMSALFEELFGKRFDDEVGLFVSAILDLPEALDSSSVRPYLKRKGRRGATESTRAS